MGSVLGLQHGPEGMARDGVNTWQVVVESQANGMCLGRGNPELCPRQVVRQGDEDSEWPCAVSGR